MSDGGKRCTKCGVSQALDCFHAHRRGAFGKDSVCKSCKKGPRAALYAEQRDRAIAARRKWYDNGGREWKRAANQQFLERTGFAKRLVQNAVRRREIQQAPCEECGDRRSQAHHDDYNKPLEVRWLCTVCHNRWHKDNEPIPLRKEASNG